MQLLYGMELFPKQKITLSREYRPEAVENFPRTRRP